MPRKIQTSLRPDNSPPMLANAAINVHKMLMREIIASEEKGF